MTTTDWALPEPTTAPTVKRIHTPAYITIDANHPALLLALAEVASGISGAPPFTPTTVEDLDSMGSPDASPEIAAAGAILDALTAHQRTRQPNLSIIEVIQQHQTSKWRDKRSEGWSQRVGGSEIACKCGWTADCAGHNGATRRALWPQHLADELAAHGFGPSTNGLTFVASLLSSMDETEGPYADQAHRNRDGWGYNADTINRWYADWIRRQSALLPPALPLEAPASSPRPGPAWGALDTLTEFLGGTGKATDR